MFYGHGTRFVDAGFVDVVWDSETCTVFTSDLEARAERIEPDGSGPIQVPLTLRWALAAGQERGQGFA